MMHIFIGSSCHSFLPIYITDVVCTQNSNPLFDEDNFCPETTHQALSINTQHSALLRCASLTCLVLSGIVGNLHGVNLQPLGAFTDVVDPGDVGTLFIDHLHHLETGDEWTLSMTLVEFLKLIAVKKK